MTLTEDIRSTIVPEWEGFEKILSAALASRSNLLNKINSYLLDTSGKQLRPLLALVTAKACSGSINQKAIACAAVSELIHTATLLHDDVVDGSDYRRGKLTVRRLFSSGASLLLGDYWLTKAIHLLISYGCPYEVLGAYSKAIEELAEGEIIQMELADSLSATEEDYMQVIRRKTASLFIASVKGPAIVSGASGEVVSSLEQYASWLGCCFQIRDDILDYRPTSETGKDSDSDIMERKITMPLLCAMRNASPEDEQRIRRRMHDITCDPAKVGQDREVAAEIREFVLEHGGLESAAAVLREYVYKAQDCLSVLAPSRSRDNLMAVAGYVGGI